MKHILVFLGLFLVITNSASALTANDARAATKAKADAFASGERAIDYIRERIAKVFNDPARTDSCVTIEPGYQLLPHAFPHNERPNKDSEKGKAAFDALWTIVRRRIIAAGFRIAADYLRETIVADRPTYKQQLGDDGRVLSESPVCPNDGNVRQSGDGRYGCYQVPRITICWDGADDPNVRHPKAETAWLTFFD